MMSFVSKDPPDRDNYISPTIVPPLSISLLYLDLLFYLHQPVTCLGIFLNKLIHNQRGSFFAIAFRGELYPSSRLPGLAESVGQRSSMVLTSERAYKLPVPELRKVSGHSFQAGDRLNCLCIQEVWFCLKKNNKQLPFCLSWKMRQTRGCV